jgi:predicted permease
MSSLLQDLRFGLRLLCRSPGFAAIVVLVLALGIGANTAIFSVVNAVLLRALPYQEPERLFQLEELNPKGDPSGVPQADIAAFRGRTHVFEQIASSYWQNLTINGPEGPENTYGALLSPEMLPMLGVRPAFGRSFESADYESGAPDVALLSDRLWKRRFARDPAVLGRSILLNGRAFTIIGVMPREFVIQQRFELWTPWRLGVADTSSRLARFWPITRLQRGIDPRLAQAEADAALSSLAPEDFAKGWRVRFTSLHQQTTGGVRPALLVLLGAVGFVLLIACLNVANLLLARFASRQREITVRTALGGGRLRILRQLLTESLLLAMIGGAAGLVLGALGSQALLRLFPERIPVPRLEFTRLDSTVLLFTFGIALLTGLVFGILPAREASRVNLNDQLRSRTGGAHPLRSILIVVETALSLILLVGAGLLLRSFDRLLAVDPGFRPEQVLTLRVPVPASIQDKAQQIAYCTRILERLQQLPGINSAGIIAPLPLGDVDANSTFHVEGRPAAPGERTLVKLRMASPAAFRALGIALRRGRVFSETDTAGASPVVLINETLARQFFAGEDPMGRRVGPSPKGPWSTIVGVVNDVKVSQLGSAPSPELYRDYRQLLFAPFATTFVLRTAGDPLLLAKSAQRAVRQVNPDQPVSDLRPMGQVVADSVATPRFYAVLLAIFAGIALVLAAAGLFGVLSYSVTQRARELSIRVALGATRNDILRAVLLRMLVLVSAGLALGIAGALVLTRLLAAQLYQIEPTDPGTYAAVSVLLIVVASAAAWTPARRALQVDPISALRCE